MTREEFIKEYNNVVNIAFACAEKARREGLLALEDELDKDKIYDRDIFFYGMSFVVDGIAAEIIEKILSNIIKHEKDEYMQILKTMQKEAVLMIQRGDNSRLIYMVLNSYVDITLKEDENKKLLDY
jgi:flagellar motor component MotA